MTPDLLGTVLRGIQARQLAAFEDQVPGRRLRVWRGHPTAIWLDHGGDGFPTDIAPVGEDDVRAAWKKPAHRTGLWTSNGRPGGWLDWCRIDYPSMLDTKPERGRPSKSLWSAFELTPADDVRVAVIDSLADLRTLLDIASINRPDLGWDERVPDFAALAEGFDAIHLTDRGQWATRLTDPSLYGWDCECTLWLRPRFTSVRELGARWATRRAAYLAATTPHRWDDELLSRYTVGAAEVRRDLRRSEPFVRYRTPKREDTP